MNSFFKNLTTEEISLTLNIFEEKFYKKESIIIKEGENADFAFFIKKGEVEVLKTIGSEENVVKRINEKDDVIFLLTNLIDGGKSQTTIKTIQDTTILKITKEKFFNFARTYPTIGEKLFENISILLAKFLRRSDETINKLYKTIEEMI